MGIEYFTMQTPIPEGGVVVLHIPKHCGVESLAMASELVQLQMSVVLRYAKRREEQAAASATEHPKEAP